MSAPSLAGVFCVAGADGGARPSFAVSAPAVNSRAFGAVRRSYEH